MLHVKESMIDVQNEDDNVDDVNEAADQMLPLGEGGPLVVNHVHDHVCLEDAEFVGVGHGRHQRTIFLRHTCDQVELILDFVNFILLCVSSHLTQGIKLTLGLLQLHICLLLLLLEIRLVKSWIYILVMAS